MSQNRCGFFGLGRVHELRSTRGQTEMRENPHDHDRLFDRGDDLLMDAARAAVNVDIEHLPLSNVRIWPILLKNARERNRLLPSRA